MAVVFVSSDLSNDPYIDTTIPKLLGANGHETVALRPLEMLVDVSEHVALANGGTDLAVLIHSTPTASGQDSPVRVLKKLRGLSEILCFRNSVKARSLPAVVIAKQSDLASGDANALANMDWVEV